jgi:hypothetical protein
LGWEELTDHPLNLLPTFGNRMLLEVTAPLYGALT